MKLLAFFCLILLFTGAVQAQDVASDWEVTVYIPNEAAIVTISAEGETGRIAVPEQANEILKVTYRPKVKLSSDHHWLAFNQGGDTGIIYLADLQAGTCCEEFGAETELSDGTKPGYFQLVGFSPDATKLALSIEQYPEGECGEFCFPDTFILTVDLETMTLKMAEWSTWNDTQLDWTDEGIVSTLRVQCLPGEMCVRQTVISSQAVRDVNTGKTLSSKPIAVARYTYDRGDHLPLTGEYISPFMYVPTQPGYEEIEYGTVIYYAPSMDWINWSADPAIIYIPRDVEFHGDIEQQFMYVRWVMDGQGVLVKTVNTENQPTLLLRDGTTHPLDIPYFHQFLAGTPDGWMMYEWDESGDPTPESMSLFHYRYSDDELSVSEIVAFPNNPERLDTPVLLGATTLGASVIKPFPTVEPLKFVG